MTDDRVRIRVRPLPEDSLEARARFESAEAKDAQVLSEAMHLHFAVADGALAMLQRHHARFVEETDFDPDAKTRPAALWLLSGRVLSLGRATLILLRKGFTTEVDPTARALDEAIRVLQLLLDDEDIRTLRDWNRGSWWGPKKLGVAERAREERQGEQIRRLCHEPPEPIAELNDQEFATASKHAHVQRPPIVETWRPELRRMLTGPDAPVRLRAVWVGYGTEWAIAAFVVVGTALTRLRGQSLWEEVVEPGLSGFERLREKAPLDPAHLGLVPPSL